jgi:glycosyltransferase involved in cell wall biosynthesis
MPKLKKIRVLHVNTFDSGGAAIACQRIHLGLLSCDVDSKILVRLRKNNIDKSTQIVLRNSFLQKALNQIKKKLLKSSLIKKEWIDREYRFKKTRPKGLEYFSYPYSDYDITQTREYEEADIIHLHWVANFLDWKSFFKENKKPVLWTLHDENPFLGAEHYAERFLGIDEEGFPIIRVYSEFELIKEIELKTIKIRALKDVKNLNIVCPSGWLLDRSKTSEVLGRFQHYLIPNGFPTGTFRNYDKNFSRKVFGLNPSTKIVLFVADSLNNERKGFVYLIKAMERLIESGNPNLQLCAIGNNSNLISHKSILELGKISDERLLALAYSAADIFIIPSLEDNLPNTMIESLLCGTPVIGFPAGGIPEVIINGQNGILCDEISVDSLYKAINHFMSGEIFFNSESISQTAKEKYSLEEQAKSYIQIYKEILSDWTLKIS